MELRNGRSKQVEAIVESVLDELQKGSEGGASAAAKAGDAAREVADKVRDADIGDKVDRLLDFIEENATVWAQVGKRLAADAAREAPVAAAAVGEAAAQVGETLGEAAGAGLEAAGDFIETIGEEVIRPTVRYGKGLRHGLVIGAAIAVLYTPWPGRELRAKLGNLVREAVDLVDAMRAGAADTRQESA